MNKLSLLPCLILIWAFTVPLSGAPGDADPAFGPVGFITTSLSPGVDRAYAAARQTDGKIVLAGVRNFNTVAVVRYNPDGTLDTSFDGDGIVTTTVSGVTQAVAVAVQTDGKIVVAANGGTAGYAVLRYNADGSPDTGFDGDGIFTDSSVGVVNALAIQPDGKIVTAGNIAINFFTADFSIVRLNPTGSFDTTFDGDGKAFVTIGDQSAGGNDFAYAIALQTDGKIVVGGESDFLSTSRDFSLVRLNFDGSLDTSFDGDGKVRTTFGGSAQTEAIRSLAVQTDGRIVAAGYGGENGIRGFALARYNADGSLDTTFDGDGKTVTPTSSNANEAANAVAIQPDGKTVAAGYSVLQIALVRYTADGALDTSFSNDGKVYTSINSFGSAQARAVLLEPNGKIVVGGNASKGGGPDEDFVLARYNADGTPSTDFGTFGYVVTNPFGQTAQSSQARSVAVQTDGKIVVGANRAVSESVTVGDIHRYTADGALDAGFAGSTSGNGIATISVPGAIAQELNSVVIQTDGKILAVGTYEDQADIGLFVVRLNTDGTRDLAFGGNGSGFALLNSENGGGLGQDIALQPDGKIVVAGASPNFNTLTIEFAAYRFNADGSRDNSFGTNGVARTPVSAANDVAFSVVIQPDGRIVLGGTINFDETATNSDIALVRFNANGTLDAAFGNGGKVITALSAFTEIVSDIQLQPDGKIVATGLKCNDAGCASGAGILLRYNSNGALDSTFDGDGVVFVQRPGSAVDILAASAIQADGKIVAAGTTGTQATLTDALVVRYNSNGSLDTSFGANGFVVSDIGGTEQEAFAVALQTDGKIVTAGYSATGTRADVAVWRYLGDSAPASRRARFDFDGDGRADVSVFRPADGNWYLQRSTDGFTSVQFGIASDRLALADYDGDGKTDVAVYRDGAWYLNRSQAGFASVQFGQPGDVPQPADFDGDGKAEIAVFRPASGTWYTLNLVSSQFNSVQFGANGDKPVASDYDGDGRADYAVFREGVWYLLQSSQGFTSVQFGIASDKPVPADYDGDGRTDPAVFRDGNWYLLQSTQGFTGTQFGIATDQPAPADYDGDGRADIAVFREGNWYLLRSSGGFQSVVFGLSGDRAVPNAFVP